MITDWYSYGQMSGMIDRTADDSAWTPVALSPSTMTLFSQRTAATNARMLSRLSRLTSSLMAKSSDEDYLNGCCILGDGGSPHPYLLKPKEDPPWLSLDWVPLQQQKMKIKRQEQQQKAKSAAA